MHTLIKPGQVLPDPLHHDPTIPVKAGVGVYAGHPSYTKLAPRAWGDENHWIDPHHMIATPMYLTGREEVEVALDSAEVFTWRLRDTALAAAERNGVSQRVVHEMCVAFGATEPLLYPGGLVSNMRDIATLPAGAVLYAGHPETPRTLNVYEWDGECLQHLLGQYTRRPEGMPLTIRTLPDAQRPVTEPADDLTLSRIALRAWRVGKTYQKRQGWCSVFNYCLTALGIDDQSVHDAGEIRGPGDVVESRASIASLPEGTLLFHRFRSSGALMVFIRDNSVHNEARTRRLWGHHDNGRNSHDTMTVAATPEEPIVGIGVSGAELTTMPAGTQYRRTGYDTTHTIGDGCSINDWSSYTVIHFPIEEKA